MPVKLPGTAVLVKLPGNIAIVWLWENDGLDFDVVTGVANIVAAGVPKGVWALVVTAVGGIVASPGTLADGIVVADPGIFVGMGFGLLVRRGRGTEVDAAPPGGGGGGGGRPFGPPLVPPPLGVAVKGGSVTGPTFAGPLIVGEALGGAESLADALLVPTSAIFFWGNPALPGAGAIVLPLVGPPVPGNGLPLPTLLAF